MAEACMDWWDELLFDIRYPVACCHIVTGTLPGDILSNTAAAISVYDRDGNPVAHEIIEWADCAKEETDNDCHAKFVTVIDEAAARLGARSLFKFRNGELSSSVSIAHDTEQGPCWFHGKSYRRGESDGGDESKPDDQRNRSPETLAAAGDVTESDFFGMLKQRQRGNEP